MENGSAHTSGPENGHTQELSASKQYKKTHFEKSSDTYLEKDRIANDLYRTAERIFVATHMVTDHLAEDTLAVRARSTVHDLLAAVPKTDARVHSESLAGIVRSIRTLVSYIETTKFLGTVSIGNADVLLKALGHFLQQCALLSKSKTNTLSDDFFDMGVGGGSGRAATPRVLAPPSATPHPLQRAITLGSPRTLQQPTAYAAAALPPSYLPTPATTTNRVRTFVFTQNERRNRIIELLKAGPRTVTELSVHFPEVSEKTIQRELASLTLDRLVETQGERRWRKYMLVGTTPTPSL
jgi:DNA-binding transcriptional ArsR family regulator